MIKIEIKLSQDGKGARVTIDKHNFTFTEASPDLSHLDPNSRSAIIHEMLDSIAALAMDAIVSTTDPKKGQRELDVQPETLNWIYTFVRPANESGARLERIEPHHYFSAAPPDFGVCAYCGRFEEDRIHV